MAVQYFRIAEVAFRLESGHPLPRLSESPLRAFHTDITEADVVVRVSRLEPCRSSLVDEPTVRDVLSKTVLSTSRGVVVIDGDQIVVRDYSAGRLQVFYRAQPDEPEGWADQRAVVALRDQLACFFPLHNGILLHSSSLARCGRAAVFLGASGAGKTTVVSQAGSGTVLGDDQIVLRRQGDGLFAHATPFGRLTDGPVSARVGGLFLLAQSSIFELEPLEGRELLRTVWESMPPYAHFLPKNERAVAFDILYAACSTLPCYRMHFPRNGVDWGALDHAMSKGTPAAR